MTVTPDPVRPFLRHGVATVAYRAAKALRGAPESFAEFQSGESTRAPSKILAHMGDLFDWALSMARGQTAWRDSEPLPWNQEVQRFFATLQAFDDFLASEEPLHAPAKTIFQGAVADALTHVGQIAMLRRLSGSPIHGENYSMAEIVPGRCGLDQSAPRREFE